jgi:hypothetical protein
MVILPARPSTDSHLAGGLARRFAEAAGKPAG